MGLRASVNNFCIRGQKLTNAVIQFGISLSPRAIHPAARKDDRNREFDKFLRVFLLEDQEIQDERKAWNDMHGQIQGQGYPSERQSIVGRRQL